MIRSLRTVLAATLLVVGATVSLAGPAEAVPSACYYISTHSEQAGVHVTGFRYWYCEDTDEFTPVSVAVYKYESPGMWLTVATGSGSARYNCNGSFYNVFRTTGTAQFAVLCG